MKPSYRRVCRNHRFSLVSRGGPGPRKRTGHSSRLLSRNRQTVSAAVLLISSAAKGWICLPHFVGVLIPLLGDTVRLPPYYLRGTTYEIFQELGRTNLMNWEFCQDFGMLECWHAEP